MTLTFDGVKFIKEWRVSHAKNGLAAAALEDPVIDSRSSRVEIPRSRFVFMHIPKTAGVSISRALAQSILGRPAETGFDEYLYGEFSEFDSMGADVRRSIYLDGEPIPLERFICGHFSYHTVENSFPDAACFTVLREPRARILSHWNYWRSLDDELLEGLGAWGPYVKKARGSFADFLSDPRLACQTDNLFVRALTWRYAELPENGFISEQQEGYLCDLAISHLRKFSLVGIVEDPHLAQRLSNLTGADIALQRLNDTPKLQPSRKARLDEEMSPTTVSLLLDRSRLDRQIWNTVAHPILGDRTSSVADSVFLSTLARHACLLQGCGVGE